MIKKLALACLLGLLNMLPTANAQQIEPLFIHGRLPNIALGNFLDKEEPSITFSELLGEKGKLVIFSFWNSACVVCIRQFEKENDLQRKYGDSVQIILVTTENRESAKHTIDKWEKEHNTRLIIPVIIEDSLIGKYLRQWNLPSYAWMARDGRLIAQTSNDFISDQTITMILEATKHLRPRRARK